MGTSRITATATCLLKTNRWYATVSDIEKTISCPACKSKSIKIREDLFCCNICPNRQNIDYFKLLGIPRSYSVNLKEAEESYKSMQKKVHPDVVETQLQKSMPEGYSQLLNKAINVIKSPTERALHLLYLLDGCSIDETKLTNDTGLLMEMMELNEHVEDCGNNRECLELEEQKNNEKLHQCDNELGTLFTEQNYSQIRTVCEKMHYLERIKSTISKRLEK